MFNAMDFRIGYRRPLRTATILRKKRQRTRLWLGVVTAVAVAVTACTWEPGQSSAGKKVEAVPAPQAALVLKASPNAPRPFYPYSIIPGGVGNREEIVQRVKTDQVVAHHYASFDVAKAHAVTVAKPRAVYVSYRKGDKVYWTAKKMTLAQGETLLSDGTNEIRGRCGNRISDTPMLPVAMHEPTEAELDQGANAFPGADADGGLQNASFDLDGLGGNPTSFQRFASFNTPLGSPTTAPPERASMPGTPGTPSGQPGAMGLEPSRYLAVTENPAMTLEPVSQTPGETTPADPGTPVVPATPTAPVTPVTPDTPITPIMPITPITPIVTLPPVSADLPSTPTTPVGPVTPVTPTTPATPTPPVKTPVPEGEVPEPGTPWLVGAALAMLLVITRRRRPAA
jgi:hypothetical protein